MAKKRKVRASTSKKKKLEFELTAPSYFDSIPLGKTIAKDPKAVLGRTLLVNMRDLTGKPSMYANFVKFYVTDVKGQKANTVLKEFTVSTSYLKRLTRRRKSKVEVVNDFITRDKKQVRIKTNVFTVKVITSTQKTLIRNAVTSALKKECASKAYTDLIQDVIYGKTSMKLGEKCREFVPIKRVEIRKTELKTLPKFNVQEKAEEDAEKVLDEAEQKQEEPVKAKK